MVVTSSVCICLTVCEVFYLCGKRFWECSRGGFHPGREDSFLGRVPLNPINAANKEPVPAKAVALGGDGEAFSPAPAYAIAVSSSPGDH